jgi:outer membrane protein TolC
MSILVFALLLADTPASPPVSISRGALYGSVSVGQATADVLPLSLANAVDRGLQHNLALILAEQQVRNARGERLEALSDLLPHVDGRVSATRQKISLDAFGFTGFPGLPTLIGPFNVVDARVSLTESALDFEAIHKEREKREKLEAARFTHQDWRALVVLACGNLYFQALAEDSRIEAGRAQLATALALAALARDRKSAGLVPALDVLRAEVEAKTRQQELIVAQNRFARAKLMLARTIGLPAGQEFRLTDRMAEAPPPAIDLGLALQTAYEHRDDWHSAEAEVRAAEAHRRSAQGEGLPGIDVNLDYGAIGQSFGGTHATYALGAALRVPLFQGGKVRAKVLQADAELQAKRAALEDFRGRVDFEVRTAALDLAAARERVEVTGSGLALSREQLRQAQDRFEAGLANNIDVVQAQDAFAAANESYIASLYDQTVTRAAMARALGAVESAYKELVRGE